MNLAGITILMQIYKLRIAVFVVEQNCPYQDIDGWDPYACPVYEKVGFVRTDYEYMEDGIPHVRMIMETGEP